MIDDMKDEVNLVGLCLVLVASRPLIEYTIVYAFMLLMHD